MKPCARRFQAVAPDGVCAEWPGFAGVSAKHIVDSLLHGQQRIDAGTGLL
ncbi:Unknown protein sequence [Pseudomonas syringae pv. syringae]|nr:Unknown protein sequence [Pseudomonas syringae pv. syringae]